MTSTFHRSAPAAERNKEPIRRILARVLPASGLVLELASGTGQHVAHFAAAMPDLNWQPSDADPQARDSIAGRIAAAGLSNVLPPLALGASIDVWPIERADAIVCINLIHIATWAAAEGLMSGAGRLLPPGGILFLYGPYRRDGRHTAPSNAAFDAGLRERNPAWGVRDLEAVTALAEEQDLRLQEIVEMPANNFSVIYCRQ